MTQRGNNEKDVLAEFLTGGSGLSCTYREQVQEEPSAAVDETLRAAARQELDSSPRHIINPFGRHWTVPASLAAMFLLSVGLVMLLSDETGMSQLQNDMLEEKLIEREMAPSVGASAYDDDSTPALSAKPAQRLQKKKEAEKKQPAAMTQPVDSGKSIEMDRSESRPRKSRARQDMQGFTSDEVDGIKPATKAPDAPAPASQMDIAAPAEDLKLAPELWLQKIENLRKQGKIKEADASLAEFRKLYPDYPVDGLHK